MQPSILHLNHYWSLLGKSGWFLPANVYLSMKPRELCIIECNIDYSYVNQQSLNL